jgi:TRAP-type C4-dicarboxylate transport system substrate-binding protein
MALFPPIRLLATAAAALGALTALPAAAQTVLTMSSWVPPTHTLTETQKEWCTMLEQKTSNKVKCN